MSDELEYRPFSVPSVVIADDGARREKLDAAALEVVETVAVCDVDYTPTANTLPYISMSIDQHVRLSDGSLIRLDMDRGVTSVRHGAEDGEPTSWKEPLGEVVNEVLDLVRADDPEDPAAHPWAELAAAARLRGISIDAAKLSALPYRVLFTAEAVETFVGPAK